MIDAEPEHAGDRLGSQPRSSSETRVDSGQPDRLCRVAEPSQRHEPGVELTNGDGCVRVVEGDGASEARDHDGQLGGRERVARPEGLDRRPHQARVDDGLDLGRCELRARAGSSRSCAGGYEEPGEGENDCSAAHVVRIGSHTLKPKPSEGTRGARLRVT